MGFMRSIAQTMLSPYGDRYWYERVIVMTAFGFFCRHPATAAAAQRQALPSRSERCAAKSVPDGVAVFGPAQFHCTLAAALHDIRYS
jgi:hypothetical protein